MSRIRPLARRAKAMRSSRMMNQPSIAWLGIAIARANVAAAATLASAGPNQKLLCKRLATVRSFPRKRESRGQALGPRFRGDERKSPLLRRHLGTRAVRPHLLASASALLLRNKGGMR